MYVTNSNLSCRHSFKCHLKNKSSHKNSEIAKSVKNNRKENKTSILENLKNEMEWFWNKKLRAAIVCKSIGVKEQNTLSMLNNLNLFKLNYDLYGTEQTRVERPSYVNKKMRSECRKIKMWQFDEISINKKRNLLNTRNRLWSTECLFSVRWCLCFIDSNWFHLIMVKWNCFFSLCQFMHSFYLKFFVHMISFRK